MFRHLIRRRFRHTWVGMLPPPYPHPADPQFAGTRV